MSGASATAKATAFGISRAVLRAWHAEWQPIHSADRRAGVDRSSTRLLLEGEPLEFEPDTSRVFAAWDCLIGTIMIAIRAKIFT